MPLYHGSTAIGRVYHGTTDINRIYKGSTLVFQKGSGGGVGAIPQYVPGTSSWYTNTGSTTAAWDTHLVDDIAILCIKTANEAVPSTPTGCTPFFTGTGTGTAGGTAVRLTAYWIRATSTSMAAIPIPDSGNQNLVAMMQFRGCLATGSPIDSDIQTALVTSSSSAISVPGITTSGPNRLVIAVCAKSLPDAATNTEFSGWTNSNLSGLAEIFDRTSTVGTGGGVGAAAGGKATAGATGNTTATAVNGGVQELLCFALLPT